MDKKTSVWQRLEYAVNDCGLHLAFCADKTLPGMDCFKGCLVSFHSSRVFDN
jgi:hypothetical protein